MKSTVGIIGAGQLNMSSNIVGLCSPPPIPIANFYPEKQFDFTEA